MRNLNYIIISNNIKIAQRLSPSSLDFLVFLIIYKLTESKQNLLVIADRVGTTT